MVKNPPPAVIVKEAKAEGWRRTVGNVSDFTQDVVSADLFIALWWTDQGLADHGDVDFGTDAAAGWLRA